MEKSIITPYKLSDSEIKEIKIGNEPTIDLLEEINKRLSSLKISSPKVNMINNEDIIKQEEQFEDTGIDMINKIKNTSKSYPTSQNYYRRTTLRDIQFEDNNLDLASQYTRDGIVEWNIDGFS